MTIEKRRLGKTDIEVTPIGLGVMQFAGGRGMFRMMFPDLSQEQMNAIVNAALEGGINWFDTAELYGRGRSERGLSRGLKAAGVNDDEVVVATKWSPMLRTAGNIAKTIDTRIMHLEGYSIDLAKEVASRLGLELELPTVDFVAEIVLCDFTSISVLKVVISIVFNNTLLD